MYGYEMTRAVKEMTGGKMEIGEAALYPALHKLVADGLLETSSEIVDNRLRKYYSLSRQGKKETVSRVNALKESIAQLQLILNSTIAHG
jgi:DNA-binding PadR family transcriptional regulator